MISINEIIRRISLNAECDYIGRILDKSGYVHGTYRNDKIVLADDFNQKTGPRLYIGFVDDDKLNHRVTICKKEYKDRESIYLHFYVKNISNCNVSIEFVGKDKKDANSIIIRRHCAWAKLNLAINGNDGAYLNLNFKGANGKLINEKIDITSLSVELVINKIWDIIKEFIDDKTAIDIISESFEVAKPAIAGALMDLEKEWINAISSKYNQLCEYYNQYKAITELANEYQESVVTANTTRYDSYHEEACILEDQLESLFFTIVDETLGEEGKRKMI